MAITDELRAFAASEASDYDDWVDGIRAIADRIDVAHRSALEKLAAQVDESEDGWVRLPVDADGVPIHVGDVVEAEKVGGGFGEPFEVVGYIMSNGELEPMDKHKCPRKRKYLRHHHTPTVEDVLREFARELDADAYGITDAKVAEFAAKLRLVGEGE